MKTPIKLLVVNVVTFVLLLTTSVYPNDVVGIVLGVPFLFIFPGYSMVSAVLPRRKGGTVETIALSLVLSLVVVPLIGLGINAIGWGIELQPVLFSVSAFILACSAVGWWRTRAQTDTEAPKHELQTGAAAPAPDARARVFSVGMALSLLGAVAVIAYFLVVPKGTEEFTSFYLVPLEATSPGGATEPAIVEQVGISLFIRNHEGREASYTVDVLINGRMDRELGPVSVAHEGEWSGEVVFRRDPATLQKIELVLHKDGGASPYLEPLYFWIDGRQ